MINRNVLMSIHHRVVTKTKLVMPPKIFPVVGFPWKRRTGINFIMRSTSVLYQKKREDFSTSNLRMRAMFTLTTLK